MQFYATLYAVLWGVAAIGLFMYAAGATIQGKAVLLALAGSLVVGLVAAFGIGILAMLLLDLSGEWAGIAVIAFMVAAGIGAGILSFIAFSAVLVTRIKPSAPSSKLRLVALALAVVCTFASGRNAYPVIPRFHPTSKLIDDARHDFSDFFEPARKELVRRGESVVPEILNAANDGPNAPNTFILAQVIGDIPGDKATEALLALLENPNPQVRLWAAFELAERKEPRALDTMLRLLSDPAMSEQLPGMISAIAEMGDPSIVPQMLSVLDLPPPKADRSYSGFSYDISFIHALGKLKHPQAYECLLSLSRHPNKRVRQDVIEQLYGYPSRHTLTTLMELLADPEIDVRRDADKALAKMTGMYWDSDGRRFAGKTTDDLRAPYSKWLQENPDKLPEQPLFEQSLMSVKR